MPKSAILSGRERILAVADELFYREGIRAVGVDTIIERAGVAKMTLYYHFASKDELVVAYLDERNRRFWTWFEKSVGDAKSPRAQLDAPFAALARSVAHPAFRGCPFLNLAIELPEPGHPGRAVVEAHKRAVLDRLRELAEGAGARDPECLASQLLLLMEGAAASTQALGATGPAAQLETVARLVIDAQLASR